MTGRDGYGDPIPPGHGEPEREDFIPFRGGSPAYSPPPPPREMFGVPHCGRCLYYHRPEEPCRR